MRRQGRIVEWNDTRGFGFIQLNGSQERAFAHISDFTHRTQAPLIGDAVTYELTSDQGRPKAREITFVGAAALARQISTPQRPARRGHSRGFGRAVAAIAMLIAAATAWHYGLPGDRRATHSPTQYAVAPVVRPTVEARQVFQCTGKRHCSQMSSCDEARFYNKYCPDTLMDGDRDGRPCEQQCY